MLGQLSFPWVFLATLISILGHSHQYSWPLPSVFLATPISILATPISILGHSHQYSWPLPSVFLATPISILGHSHQYSWPLPSLFLAPPISRFSEVFNQCDVVLLRNAWASSCHSLPWNRFDVRQVTDQQESQRNSRFSVTVDRRRTESVTRWPSRAAGNQRLASDRCHLEFLWNDSCYDQWLTAVQRLQNTYLGREQCRSQCQQSTNRLVHHERNSPVRGGNAVLHHFSRQQLSSGNILDGRFILLYFMFGMSNSVEISWMVGSHCCISCLGLQNKALPYEFCIQISCSLFK